MGMIVRPHEVYFGSFFEHFNMRFGPPHPLPHPLPDPAPDASLKVVPVPDPVWRSGGIAEIAALQKEFQIFRPGRAFIQSASLLGLGGLLSSPAKDRWLEYLGRLPHMESDDTAQNGDQRIVMALEKNLELREPLPCCMAAHDGRKQPIVMVREESPVFYLGSVSFLMIYLPMRPE